MTTPPGGEPDGVDGAAGGDRGRRTRRRGRRRVGGGQAFWRDAARFAAMSVVRLISWIVSGSIGTVPCGLLGVDLDGGSVEWR
jgi:hypothetical protein